MYIGSNATPIAYINHGQYKHFYFVRVINKDDSYLCFSLIGLSSAQVSSSAGGVNKYTSREAADCSSDVLSLEHVDQASTHMRRG